MSSHAGPPGFDQQPPVAEPTFAERARTLVHLGDTGALATLSRKHPGHPFASVMPYAPDGTGQPLLLISTMAMHTQNLLGDPRASLLVTQGGGDVLATGRVTLMGEARRVDAPDVARARATYLERHANASYWVDFGDFAFWRLHVDDVYVVGGFAAMDWVTADAYAAASPDPLADAASGIIEHMNVDHAAALLDYARVFGREDAAEARMVAVDRLGFKLRLTSGDRRWNVRIAFPGEVRAADEARRVFIDMLRQARQSDPGRA
jgi:putative heme iron utilization protein